MTQSFQIIPTNGVNINTFVEGEGKPVIFVHGWPESWYSWRHQIDPFKAAGYKVIIPDIRGYGRSDKPKDINSYSLNEITKDLIGILNYLNEDTAHIIGHDWGAPISWYTSLLFPERVLSVSGLSVPFNPFDKIPPIKLYKSIFKDIFFYILYFQKKGAPEKELEENIERTLRLIYCNSDALGMKKMLNLSLGGLKEKKEKTSTFLKGMNEPEFLPKWLSEKDMRYFVGEFQNSGMLGPLNRYRCMNLDWSELYKLSLNKITKPACFITGSLDPVNFFIPGVNLFDSVGKNYEDLRTKKLLNDVGHWTQQEAPNEVNKILLDFLEKI